ncbi:hypothetical protein IPJ72_01870 [Candidatus Peregrinibacteria bacterium]|nr:MAG: hypothetical protein IPJ72_01870 [Candidatus Peregrinibacteria bacterium]
MRTGRIIVRFLPWGLFKRKIVGKGQGSSKQSAEQKAAEDALKRLKWV